MSKPEIEEFVYLGCSMCINVYSNSEGAKTHNRVAHQKRATIMPVDRDYATQCPMCTEWFDTPKGRAIHIRQKHNEETASLIDGCAFKCAHCLFTRTNKHAVIRHSRVCHSTESTACREPTPVPLGEALRCSQCPLSFRTIAQRAVHMRTRHNECIESESDYRPMYTNRGRLYGIKISTLVPVLLNKVVSGNNRSWFTCTALNASMFSGRNHSFRLPAPSSSRETDAAKALGEMAAKRARTQ